MDHWSTATTESYSARKSVRTRKCQGREAFRGTAQQPEGKVIIDSRVKVFWYVRLCRWASEVRGKAAQEEIYLSADPTTLSNSRVLQILSNTLCHILKALILNKF